MSNTAETPSPPTMAKKPQISTRFKLFLTCWAFMENALFAGLRAGWSALVYVLKQERIYSYLCEDEVLTSSKNRTQIAESFENGTEPFLIRLSQNDSLTPSSPFAAYNAISEDSNGNNLTSYVLYSDTDTGLVFNLETENSSILETLNRTSNSTANEIIACAAQDAVFNQCFTVASATMALSALMYGHLNYKYGIRVPRLLSVVIFTTGSLTLAFVDKDLPWLIYPGLLMVSSGGMALYLTNNQISYMFTTGGAAVVGLLCGALEASSFVQTIIKIAYENGISLQYSYLAVTGLYQLTLISTFFLLPKDYITNAKEAEATDKEYAVVKGGCEKDNSKNTELNGSATFSTSGKPNAVGFDGSIGNISGIDLDYIENGGDKIVTQNGVVDDGELSRDCAQIEQLNSRNADVSAVVSDAVVQKEPTHDQQGNADDTNIIAKENKSDIQKSGHTNDLKTNTLGVTTPPSHKESNSNLEPRFQSKQSDVLMGQSKSAKNSDGGHDVTVIAQSGSFVGGISGNKTLWQCILSKTFFLYLFWAVVVQIILLMCLGTFNPWLEYVTHNNDSEVSKYTDVLFYSMLGSPILALGIGVGIDALKRVDSKDPVTASVRTLHSATVSLGATSILGVIVCAFVTTCTRDVIIATSIALVIFRTALYCCGTTFVRIMYPTHYFGLLCGIMSVLAGTLSFVQYPLFLWVQYADEAWMEAFGFLGLLGIISLAHPGYLFWKSHQLKRRMSTNS